QAGNETPARNHPGRRARKVRPKRGHAMKLAVNNTSPVAPAARWSGMRRPGMALLGMRVLRLAATTLAAGLLCATMVRFSPGFGLDERQLDPSLSGQTQQAMRSAHDAERNPAWFYVTYLQRMLAGNLGFSNSLSRPI